MDKLIIYEVQMNYFCYEYKRINKDGHFFSLGNFDDISINELKIENKAGDLTPIIEKYYKNKIKCNIENKDILNQTFIIFKKLKETQENQYKQFCENNKWNFQFITFVYAKNSLNEYTTFEEEYKKYLELEDDNTIIFDTLDNSSFISIIKTKTYQEGLEKILKLSFKYSDNYCFSIVTLNNKYNECDEERINLKINLTIKNYREMMLSINDIFSENDGIGYNLGNTDIYFLKNITVKQMYDLFKGIVCKSNELNQIIFSIQTNITKNMELIDLITEDYDNPDNYYENKQTILKNFFEKLESLSSVNSIVWNEYLYHLYSLIMNLKQINTYNYCDLAYITILPSLKILMKKLDEIINDNIITANLLVDYYRYLNDVRDVVKLVANSSYHTHHDSMSCIDSNEICGKLVAFYNIFTYNIVQIFSRENNVKDKFAYGFLVVPQLYERIEVHVLNDTKDPEDRLLLVKVPIYQLYNISMVLITLAHECGHFIGDKLRNRESRLETINNVICNYCAEIVFPNCNDKAYQKVKNLFLVIIKNKVKDLEKKGDVEYLSAYEDKIRNELINYLIENEKKIFKELINGYEKYVYKMYNDNDPSLKEKNYVELINLKKDFTNEISNNYVKLYSDSNYTLKVLTGVFFSILRECFADLFAINLLDLSCNDYYNTFVKANFGIENDSFERQITVRFALMVKVKGWKLDDTTKFYQKVKKIIDIMDKETSKREEIEIDFDILRPFNYEFVWHKTMLYLNKCNDAFGQLNNIDEFKNIYHSINEKNTDISRIMNIVNWLIKDFRINKIKNFL